MEVNQEFCDIIKKYAKVSGDYVFKDEDDLVYDLGMDSLSLVELIVDVEEEFDIEIEEENMDVIYKYGRLLDYIKGRVG